MQIVDFTASHTKQALQVAKQNYEDERRHIPALPRIDSIAFLSSIIP